MRTAGIGRTDRRAAWLRWRWDGICPGIEKALRPRIRRAAVVRHSARCDEALLLVLLHTDQPWAGW